MKRNNAKVYAVICATKGTKINTSIEESKSSIVTTCQLGLVQGNLASFCDKVLSRKEAAERELEEDPMRANTWGAGGWQMLPIATPTVIPG